MTQARHNFMQMTEDRPVRRDVTGNWGIKVEVDELDWRQVLIIRQLKSDSSNTHIVVYL